MYPPDVPVMLAGVSMGGLVATLAVLDAGISPDALILVAPLVDVDMSAAMKAQAVVGGLLARAVPNARITPGVEPRRLSKAADAVREYVEDPRVFVGNLTDHSVSVLTSDPSDGASLPLQKVDVAPGAFAGDADFSDLDISGSLAEISPLEHGARLPSP